MAIQRLTIKEFAEASRHQLVLDVRSPGEYSHARLPSALSFPLFTDEERKVVGTTYKQKSREEAIKIGLDYFAPKMRRMVEEAEALSGEAPAGTRTVYVYCWRGGMRSAAVAWLLDLYGFRVYTLAGGYKAFRNYVLQTFEQPFPLRILGGYTGSGKTEVLAELGRRGEPVVDLEKIASHKGSAFGSFRMPPQPTQEMFENLLALELQDRIREGRKTDPSLAVSDMTPIWLEDESQRIGDLNLPNALWESMRNAPLTFLEIPFEERLEHIMKEYGDCEREKLIDSTRRISQRLGGLDAKNAIEFLENGETKEAFRILLRYYDKRYLKGLHNRENISALLTRISCEKVTSGNALILTKPQPA